MKRLHVHSPAREAQDRRPPRSVAVAALAALLAVLPLAHAARATDARNPDWPCAQIKVPEVSAAAVWSGPPIDDVGAAWQQDGAIREAVARLAARRTPLAEAEQLIATLVTGSSAEKQRKAKLLFAGIFETLNHQRSEVMAGIERFTRRQRELADRIRGNTMSLRELQNKGSTDSARLDELGNAIAWDTRIFEDRRHTTRYVCEVPTLIEQRLFALGRAIQQRLD